MGQLLRKLSYTSWVQLLYKVFIYDMSHCVALADLDPLARDTLSAGTKYVPLCLTQIIF